MTVHEPIQAVAAEQVYRLTQRDFMMLSEHGAFDALKKTELIEGVIVSVNAQHSRHARMQTLLFRVLADACDRLGGVAAWLDASVSVDDCNLPQPDIFVATSLPDDGPIPLEVVKLVVEVADSSLRKDLGVKARVYARAGIAEYWIADVTAQVVHQLWLPSPAGYAERREIAFGETLACATIVGLAIDLPGPA